MPGQKRSNEALCEDEDELELQRDDQKISEEPKEEEEDVEQAEQAESDDDGSPSSSWSDKDEFILVKLAEVRKEVQCPICLGIIRKTRTVMECLHRFCRECIDKSMRLGNKECPACRAHCASRRSLRDDPNYDALIAALYADIDRYEAEEFAFHEEEKTRNKQIQASIAQTCRRQLEALGKKRANGKATAAATSMGRSSRNLRGRRSRKSDEEDGDNDDGAKDSSSTDDHSAEVRPKRYKRWAGAQSSQPSLPSSSEDNEAEATREVIVGSPEILAWGRGGIRSHTRHGNPSASAGKNARNSRLPKLIDHLGKLPQNADEMDIHLKIVSLDEQNIPDSQYLNLCGNPTMSIGHVCQYVALEKGLQGNEIELLLVKGNPFKPNPSASSKDLATGQPEPVVTNPSASSNVLAAEPPEDTVPNSSTDELQMLEEHQMVFDVAKTSGQNNLTIAYRKKLCSSNIMSNGKTREEQSDMPKEVSDLL